MLDKLGTQLLEAWGAVVESGQDERSLGVIEVYELRSESVGRLELVRQARVPNRPGELGDERIVDSRAVNDHATF